jgi:hypothetical protein
LLVDKVLSTYNSEKWIFSQLNKDEDNKYEVFFSLVNQWNSTINKYNYYIQALYIDYKIKVLD